MTHPLFDPDKYELLIENGPGAFGWSMAYNRYLETGEAQYVELTIRGRRIAFRIEEQNPANLSDRFPHPFLRISGQLTNPDGVLAPLPPWCDGMAGVSGLYDVRARTGALDVQRYQS